MDRYELAAQLRAIMHRQHQLLAMLRDYLHDNDLIQAHTFAMPPFDQQTETRADIQAIPITHSAGRPAMQAAIEAWGHLFAGTDENTRLVYRLPGVLQIHSRFTEEITGIVTAINADRQRFRQLVTQSGPLLGSHNVRYEFLRSPSMFPRLITLQLYRQITLADHTLRTVSFCWAHKHTMQRTSKTQMMEMLQSSQDAPPHHVIDAAQWREQIADEMVLLSQLPNDARLVIRRPQPVQPQAWMVNDAHQRRMQVASTPILILGERPAKIGRLKDYDATQKRAARRPKTTPNDALIPRLWLYQEG